MQSWWGSSKRKACVVIRCERGRVGNKGFGVWTGRKGGGLKIKSVKPMPSIIFPSGCWGIQPTWINPGNLTLKQASQLGKCSYFSSHAEEFERFNLQPCNQCIALLGSKSSPKCAQAPESSAMHDARCNARVKITVRVRSTACKAQHGL